MGSENFPAGFNSFLPVQKRDLFHVAAVKMHACLPGLLLHPGDQLRSRDPGQTRIVFNGACGDCLPARHAVFQNQRAQTGAPGVDPRGKPRAAPAQNNQIINVHKRFLPFSLVCMEQAGIYISAGKQAVPGLLQIRPWYITRAPFSYAKGSHAEKRKIFWEKTGFLENCVYDRKWIVTPERRSG